MEWNVQFASLKHEAAIVTIFSGKTNEAGPVQEETEMLRFMDL
jgi:hypothetical protein